MPNLNPFPPEVQYLLCVLGAALSAVCLCLEIHRREGQRVPLLLFELVVFVWSVANL